MSILMDGKRKRDYINLTLDEPEVKKPCIAEPLKQGYIVLPVLQPQEVIETREQLIAELSQDPVYKDPALAIEQGMVMGGFGALPTAHSYHNKVVRALRIKAHKVAASLCPPDKKMTQCPDRVMVRTANQLPSKESWHRDKSPFAEAGSDMFGGWINLNDFDEHFVCCPGSQQVGNSGAQNFETIPKEDRPYWKARQVKVPIPPGHMIVFYENIVHCVNPGKRTLRYRLFTGWCIGPQTPDPTLIARMKNFQTPKIKGGMQPPLYSRQHMACWMDRIVKFSENISEEYCYDHLVKSGKNEGKTLHIAKRFPMEPGMQYPAYSDEELAMFMPHTPEQYVNGMTPASVCSCDEPPVKKCRKDYEDFYLMLEADMVQALGGHTLEGLMENIPSCELQKMSDETLEELSYKLRKAKWDKKAWCEHVECDRDTAISKGSLGGYTTGELGTHYFYFSSTESDEFTDEQHDMLINHIACCYMHGQPCASQLDDEWNGDPCECRMGHDNQSYWFETNLGKETFVSECQVGLIEPKWVYHSETWDTSENIYSEEELKAYFGDLNNLTTENLTKAAKYLKNPKGKLEIVTSGDTETYTEYNA